MVNDYDFLRHCETCDSVTVIDDWDDEVGMCIACAIVGTEGEEEDE